jgi:hypothetical protein
MQKCIIIIFSLVFILSNFYLHAQTVQVSKNVKIETGLKQYIVGEPHVAVHPKNKNHLLAGAMLINPGDNKDAPCISFYSIDGGKNWVTHIFPDKNSADPWCVINENGEAAFSLLGGANLWVYHSKDGGKTWTDSTDLGIRHDHETMTTAKGDKNENIVYLTSVQEIRKNNRPRSSVFLARSDDGGKTFPLRKNMVLNNLSLNTMTPAVLSDGTLLVSYNEFSHKTPTGFKRLERNLSWVVASDDKGETFREPQFITQAFGPSFPVLAVDKTERFKDRLYWIGRSVTGKDILLYTSSDKGETWSETKVYSSDKITTIPNIAITKDGWVAVSFYEKTEGENFCQSYKLAVSGDGGKTFSVPVQVSEKEYCPDKEKNGDALKRGWSSGGHYTGLTALPDGGLFTIWADARDGSYQLYFATVTITQ